MIYGMMMPEGFKLTIPMINVMLEHIVRSSKENGFPLDNLQIFETQQGIGWICGDEKEIQERLKNG